ncbi:MAG: undecaprenyl-diphosphate phosphatase [Clostridia bacterium]|nr:undecaprenyl-diphosphate phosphatase [Clostridia bacterium]
MEFLKYIAMGVMQGITEFLPVSSSGHLALLKHLFGDSFLEIGMSYDILLHLATLIAVFCVYRKDIWNLITAFFRMVKGIFTKEKSIWEDEYVRLILLLIVGCIPAGIAGFAFGDIIEAFFAKHLWSIGAMLLVTSVLMFLCDRLVEGNKSAKTATWKQALLTGLFQACAIVPGLSRSGSTVTGGLLAGLSREFAVKYSFLLSIPVILGAAITDIPDLLGEAGASIAWGSAICGMIVATAVGYLSIRFMLKLFSNKKLSVFGWYCLVVGLATILISVIG